MGGPLPCAAKRRQRRQQIRLCCWRCWQRWQRPPPWRTRLGSHSSSSRQRWWARWISSASTLSSTCVWACVEQEQMHCSMQACDAILPPCREHLRLRRVPLAAPALSARKQCPLCRNRHAPTRHTAPAPPAPAPTSESESVRMWRLKKEVEELSSVRSW